VSQGLRDTARHVIRRISNPPFLISMASNDVANNICQGPLHTAHLDPSSHDSNGMICHGERHLAGPTKSTTVKKTSS
jgi:hypothetical protein